MATGLLGFRQAIYTGLLKQYLPKSEEPMLSGPVRDPVEGEGRGVGLSTHSVLPYK